MDKFLVVDFETTGNKAKEGDRIIQIGAVLVENREIISQYSTLVNPRMQIPPFIQQLTQITDEMVQSAPDIQEVLPNLLAMLDGAVFVAHNVHFDLGFLQHTLADCGYLPYSGPIIDTVELSRLLLPNQTGYKLTELSVELEIEHANPHQADSDALATAHVLISLLEKLDHLPYMTIQRLAELAKGFTSDISSLIRKLEQQRLIEGKFEEEGESLEMYRQLALRRKVPASRMTELDELDEPFEDFLDEIHQLLPLEMEGFEWRPSQRKMMEQIYHAFSHSKHLFIEAGTGTGKSLAYLVPSIYWAFESGKKILISTHTIQLQEQLFDRDLPLLERLFKKQVIIALLKGRNNYLCIRKFEQSLSDSTENYDLQLSKGQILTWLTETETGDVEELNLPSGGTAYWRQVQSDANSCLNSQCPWFSRCFYYSARRKAQEADIVITNHSLLFTDMMAEQRILPAYEYAVIDEAHHFEDVASNHLGLSLNSLQVDALLTGLVSDRGTGILERLDKELDAWHDSPMQMKEGLADCARMVVEGREYSRDLFNRLYTWGSRSAKEGMEAGRAVKRYDSRKWTDKVTTGITQAATHFIEWMAELGKSLDKIYAGFHLAKEIPLPIKGLATDLNGLIKDCAKQMQLIRQLLLDPRDENVFWMELDMRSTRRVVFLYMVPIDVASLIQENFFSGKESVVLTSATLSVNQSFSYSLKQMGLEEEEVITSQHASPFDYRAQTLFCVPQDAPPLNHGDEEAFVEHLTDSLAQLARTTKGRMLVLFTSHQMLRMVYEKLKEQVSAEGVNVLGHGLDSHSRSKLTKQFKQTPNCILLGTSSFWEGVDIPGEALSCLAIVRLPFWPPNHPVLEARSEYIKSRKGNPFMEMSVPQAVIRFKQGFGRLVRSQKDKGVVVVFDKRIVESRYGKYFLRSLPETPLYYRPLRELLPMIEEWLG